ncbi:MAG: hypothetical protein LBM96_05925 [Methanobrevibacter sp.]|jgi:hypothetical protein|nr:hypothetical protein [Candidatus Methanoflexus mossambicus]
MKNNIQYIQYTIKDFEDINLLEEIGYEENQKPFKLFLQNYINYKNLTKEELIVEFRDTYLGDNHFIFGGVVENLTEKGNFICEKTSDTNHYFVDKFFDESPKECENKIFRQKGRIENIDYLHHPIDNQKSFGYLTLNNSNIQYYLDNRFYHLIVQLNKNIPIEIEYTEPIFYSDSGMDLKIFYITGIIFITENEF